MSRRRLGGLLVAAAACRPVVRPPEVAPMPAARLAGAPAQARAAYVEAVIAESRGDPAAAEAAFARARAYDPDAPALALALGRLDLRAGAPAAAAAHWLEALRRGPTPALLAEQAGLAVAASTPTVLAAAMADVERAGCAETPPVPVRPWLDALSSAGGPSTPGSGGCEGPEDGKLDDRPAG